MPNKAGAFSFVRSPVSLEWVGEKARVEFEALP